MDQSHTYRLSAQSSALIQLNLKKMLVFNYKKCCLCASA
ncbi:hypothetical protein SynA15127_02703 [Synechococcus sp. A15-127]|nr:hypothetical protein SynA15127_02703 [Synechococcus sp. A15-127]